MYLEQKRIQFVLRRKEGRNKKMDSEKNKKGGNVSMKCYISLIVRAKIDLKKKKLELETRDFNTFLLSYS